MSARTVRVKLPAFRALVDGLQRDAFPARTVELRPTGDWRDAFEVYDGERLLGNVWKGSRIYSPPLYKGSRIAKYHKDVPEWHASVAGSYATSIRRDTRKLALLDLVAKAAAGEGARCLYELTTDHDPRGGAR